MIKKVYFYSSLLVIMILCTIIMYMSGNGKKSNEIVSGDTANKEMMNEEELNSDDNEDDTVVEISNRTISLYSWHFELSNQPLFYQLSKPLKDLGINRIYQSISARNIKEPEMAIMIQNLSDLGIETVALTGDKSWVEDGLDEFESILKGIQEYNKGVLDEYKIRKIALDVEVHRVDGWNENKVELFEQYIAVMKEAKKEANSYGLEVIQIIPTRYDDVDKKMFQEFLQECCDEISIMNYEKKNADTAIAYEVKACKQYNIPVETIFETMPVSDEYGITEDITYFYDGMDALINDSERMKEIYGKEIGIAYHHFNTIYEMATGQKLGEVYLDIADEEKMQYPGNLLLYGSDGSRLLATPYWPKGRRHKGDSCWLLCGVKEAVSYRIVYYDIFQEIPIADKVYFSQGDDSKLKLQLSPEE